MCHLSSDLTRGDEVLSFSHPKICFSEAFLSVLTAEDLTERAKAHK